MEVAFRRIVVPAAHNSLPRNRTLCFDGPYCAVRPW